jgi:hypothetical protein
VFSVNATVGELVDLTRRHETHEGAPLGRASAAESAAAVAQHVLLGGFTAVAAGISAQGLIGFARDNMALRGPWPYLLCFALDGAAGMCAGARVRHGSGQTRVRQHSGNWGVNPDQPESSSGGAESAGMMSV